MYDKDLLPAVQEVEIFEDFSAGSDHVLIYLTHTQPENQKFRSAVLRRKVWILHWKSPSLFQRKLRRISNLC